MSGGEGNGIEPLLELQGGWGSIGMKGGERFGGLRAERLRSEISPPGKIMRNVLSNKKHWFFHRDSRKFISTWTCTVPKRLIYLSRSK